MFKKITRKKIYAFLSKHGTDEKVLDIGSGGSSYEKFFPNRLCVDIDKERNPDIVADVHNLPFKDGEFETVLCTEALEHFKEPKKAIDEINRILKFGGKLILTTRFVYPLHDIPNDYWRFTKYGLEELFKEWNVLEIQAETKNFSTIAVLLQRICYQSNLRMNRPIKLIIFFVAWIFSHLDWLTKEEFGDIKKVSIEKEIMPSGYYVICQKK